MALKTITVDSTSRMCCLVVGKAGVGKTSLLRTIAGQEFNPNSGQWEQVSEPDGRVCTLSAESGLLCVRDLVVNGQVEGYEIGSYQDMREAFQALMSPQFQDRYRWVFIDSLTEISARCVESVKQKFPSSSNAYQMWGEYNDSMTQLIKCFRDMTSYNVVFTALETVERDQETGRRYKFPMITGSGLKERLTSYFDEVFYMKRMVDENGNERTIFQTREPAGLAKDRSGRLAAIESANLLTVQRKIME